MPVPLRQDDPGSERERTGLLRYAGMGFELAAAIVGLTLLGLWIDYRFGTSPVGVLVGSGVGVVGGLYNFIRAALKLSAGRPRAKRPANEHRNDDDT